MISFYKNNFLDISIWISFWNGYRFTSLLFLELRAIGGTFWSWQGDLLLFFTRSSWAILLVRTRIGWNGCAHRLETRSTGIRIRLQRLWIHLHFINFLLITRSRGFMMCRRGRCCNFTGWRIASLRWWSTWSHLPCSFACSLNFHWKWWSLWLKIHQ